MEVLAAQIPASSPGDDKVFTTDAAVIMLDGASAFVPQPVSASIYADHLGRSLQARLTGQSGSSLRGILADAISSTADELGLATGSAPSSTVAIVRWHGSMVHVLVLGDTLVVTPHHTFTDDRMDRLDLEPALRYRERLAAGHGYGGTHTSILAELQRQQAHHRNQPGGYWIAEADPVAAEHALTWSLHVSETPWVVLATDGAYNTMQHLGLDDWPEVASFDAQALAGLLRQCHDWESTVDPDGIALPRAKRHDDKSLALLVQGKARVKAGG